MKNGSILASRDRQTQYIIEPGRNPTGTFFNVRVHIYFTRPLYTFKTPFFHFLSLALRNQKPSKEVVEGGSRKRGREENPKFCSVIISLSSFDLGSNFLLLRLPPSLFYFFKVSFWSRYKKVSQRIQIMLMRGKPGHSSRCRVRPLRDRGEWHCPTPFQNTSLALIEESYAENVYYS